MRKIQSGFLDPLACDACPGGRVTLELAAVVLDQTRELAERGGAMVDVNVLVQEVLRKAYLQTTANLSFYAEKVKFFNELKQRIRDEMKSARTELAKYGGQADDAILSPPYAAKEFITEFTGTTKAQAMAIVPEVSDPSGAGVGEYAGGCQQATQSGQLEGAAKAALDPAPSDTAKMFATEPGSYVVAVDADKSVQFYGPDGKQIGCVWGDSYYRKGAVMDDSISGDGVMHFGDDSIFILPDGSKVCLNAEKGEGGESATVGVTILSGLQRVSLGKMPDGTEGDGVVHDDRITWDGQNADQVGANRAGVMALQPTGDLLLLVGSEFKAVSSRDWDAYKSGRTISTSGAAVSVNAAVTAAATDGAYVQALTGTMDTKGKLDTYVKNLEEKLNGVGDDAQLANVDLQNVLQKQQQTMQTMSNISKMLHDTALAIIRKIGG